MSSPVSPFPSPGGALGAPSGCAYRLYAWSWRFS
ncbi:MAG: hypothetical protein QOE44_640 [Solirubrobacteraceae bacterium]|nr:hypothetical protein [Solirubrobacteraceae bacterium]